MRLLSLGSLLLTSLVSGQSQTIVSPNFCNGVEGTTANAFPWTSANPKRYSQIHSDVGGTPKFITKIAGRMNGTASSFTGTRALDIELFMGDSVPYNNCSFVISNNYIGPKTQVLTRQIVNAGPFSGGSPAAFSFAIPLATGFFYSGVNSLLWELVQYSNTATGSAPSTTDVETSTMTSAAIVNTGTGCIATGQVAAMTHVLGASDSGGTLSLGFYVARAPANALTVLYLGASNPNTTVPGLCGRLYTDLLVSFPLGISDATGSIGGLSSGVSVAGGPCVLMAPNTFPGAVLFTQVHAIDVGSTNAIPIVNSEGHSFTVPSPNLSRVAKLSRIYSNDSTTAANGYYSDTLSIGYGAVMQFTY